MNMTDRFAVLILAAGLSSRMGCFKPLLPLANSSVVRTAIAGCLEAGIRNIVVVTGHRRSELLAEISNLPVQTVHNECYRGGMFSSVLTGVKALPADIQAFYLLPGDMPLVQPSTYTALALAFKPGLGVIYPEWQGRRGHPPLIAASCIPELLKWHGEGGLRCFLQQYAQLSATVSVSDPGILLDMDTPTDYQRLQEYTCESKEANMHKQQINCSISNCHYWEKGNICQASAILVTSDTMAQSLPEAMGAATATQVAQSPVSKRNESCCQTFVERAAYQARQDGVQKLE